MIAAFQVAASACFSRQKSDPPTENDDESESEAEEMELPRWKQEELHCKSIQPDSKNKGNVLNRMLCAYTIDILSTTAKKIKIK